MQSCIHHEEQISQLIVLVSLCYGKMQESGFIKIFPPREFPGGPVVKTSLSNVAGKGLIPGWGVKILHASWPKN